MKYNYTTSQAPDEGVRVGPEPNPIPNATLAMAQGDGVQVGPEPIPTPNVVLAMTQPAFPVLPVILSKWVLLRMKIRVHYIRVKRTQPMLMEVNALVL